GPLAVDGPGRRRDEVRDLLEPDERSEALVQAGARPAREDQRVKLGEPPLEHVAAPPQLRRPAVAERAAPAGRPLADALLVLPEDMGRADEPLLVRGVELDPLAQTERARSAEERRVVEVHD